MLKLHKESHVDHGLSQAHIDHILERFKDKEGFFLDTFELPESLGQIPCGLFGPVMGDAPVPEAEVVYEKRGSRQWPSRLTGREPHLTRTVTVIGGEYLEEPCILYTAFGGPATPKEPGDNTIKPEEKEKCEAFWKEHALAKR